MSNTKQLQDPYLAPPVDPEDKDFSIEVPVIIEDEEYSGYMEIRSRYWYVHLGGNTVGHRKMSAHEIDGWIAKAENQTT
jgi:hypothetical protein